MRPGDLVSFGVAMAILGSATLASAASLPRCTGVNLAPVIDTSSPVTSKFLNNIRKSGVTTIARYYDYPDETLPGKTLRAEEVALITGRGLNLLVVFQHHNDQLASFTPERGAGDAARALALASQLHQPAGSAIYFGVDGGWSSADELASITSYFKAASEKFTGSGYRVGVYGSGLVCSQITGGGLASLCWLSNARSWPGYDGMIKSGAWALRQSSPVHCAGRDLDFDRTNPHLPDFGQYAPSPASAH